MSNYYVRRTGDDSDYLAHSGRFKYITKLNIGGKVRYIYDQAQLAAARAGRAAGNFVDRNITGASARRSYATQKGLYEKYSSKGSASARSHAAAAKRAAQNSQRRYNRSLFGRAAGAASKIAGAGNAARNFVGQQATRARNAASKVPGNVSRFVDRNITGASAKRSYNAQKELNKKYSSKGSASARKYAAASKRAAQNSKKRYDSSLFGRISGTASRAASAGNAARNFVGQQAARARDAGQSFAGTVSKEAYRVGRRTKRKVKGLFTPKKAPRKPAKEVNVRDYAKINRNNEKSAEQYQYFNKDQGWATNSRAAAERLSGHARHNRRTAKRKKQGQRRTIQ